MDSPPGDELGEHFAAVVLELAPDGIAVTDQSGRILHANSRFEVLFGYPREHLVGRSVEMLLPERLRSIHRAHRADYGEAPVTRPMGAGLDLRARHADGSEFSVEIALSPVTMTSGMRTIMVVRQAEDREAGDLTSRDRAVREDEDRIATAMNDEVIRPIFAAGLDLHGLLETADGAQAARLRSAIDQLDDAIHAIRTIVFDRDLPGGAETIDLRSVPGTGAGIEYRMDRDDVLTGVGGEWATFALENGGAALVEPAVGTSLWSCIDGQDVRALWQLLVARARSGVAVRVPFRCDAPTMRRWFQMTITLEADGVVHFRSTLDHTEPRLHVALNPYPIDLVDLVGHDHPAPPLEVCSWCERCREGDAWFEIEDVVSHLRLLGVQPPPAIAHSVCPTCEGVIVAEAERAVDGDEAVPPLS